MRLHNPMATRNSRVTEPEAKALEGCYLDAKQESKMLRRHLDATSPVIPMYWHRETVCSQKKMIT